MGKTGRPPKTFSRVEREWIADNLGSLSVRDMAERLDRPKSTVGREVMAIRKEVGLPMPPDPRWPDARAPDPPDGTEARLLELARTLRAKLLTADERNVARIAEEYRETVLALARLDRAEPDPGESTADEPDEKPGGTFLDMVRARHRGGAQGQGAGGA